MLEKSNSFLFPWALGAAIIMIVTVIGSCNLYTRVNQSVGLVDDNPIEEALEEVVDMVVEKYTGIDPEIDFTQ